jgi:serine protease Do
MFGCYTAGCKKGNKVHRNKEYKPMKPRKTWIAWIIVPILLLTAGVGSAFALFQPHDRAVLAANNVETTPVALLPAGSLDTLESVFEQVYAQVNPSVVNIQVVEKIDTTARQNSFGFGNQTPQDQIPLTVEGSGFVWDTQGHIVTNNHVVSGASQIRVTFADGSTVEAKLVGGDPYSDLAVIQVDVPASQLTPVEITDSTQVKVGEIVIAIGNPYGFEGSMSQGIISGLGRSLPAELNNNTTQSGATYSIPDIIQTDASINPGNSGGVLVDENGKLVGVTFAIESSTNSNSGVGFAIPSAIVKKVVPSLIQSGSYKYSWLGISATYLTLDLAQAMGLGANQQGALVVTVTADGPASKAGLQASDQSTTINGVEYPIGGDVITAINGQTVKRFDDVISYLFNSTQPGQTITLTVLRQGHEQQVKLTLGERPAQ